MIRGTHSPPPPTATNRNNNGDSRSNRGGNHVICNGPRWPPKGSRGSTTERPASAHGSPQERSCRVKIKSILKKRPLLHSHSLGSSSSSSSSSSTTSVVGPHCYPARDAQSCERKSILKNRDARSPSIISSPLDSANTNTNEFIMPSSSSTAYANASTNERKPRPILKRNSLDFADQFDSSLRLSHSPNDCNYGSHIKQSNQFERQRRSRSTSSTSGGSTTQAVVTFTTSPSLSGASSLSSSPPSTSSGSSVLLAGCNQNNGASIQWCSTLPYHYDAHSTTSQQATNSDQPTCDQLMFSSQSNNADHEQQSTTSNSSQWPQMRRTKKSGSFSSSYSTSSTYSTTSSCSSSSNVALFGHGRRDSFSHPDCYVSSDHGPGTHFQVDTLVVELAADEIERNERSRQESTSASFSSRLSIGSPSSMKPILKNRRSIDESNDHSSVYSPATTPVRPILKKYSLE